MQSLLQDIVVGNIFAFLLIFMRLGTAFMLMPGFGDTFVNTQSRLMFALAFSFVLAPFMASMMPAVPTQAFVMVMLLVSELIIGFFIGTVMRIVMSALDTAGMIVSMQAGFSNAMIFNPVTATQGSVVGAIYSVVGMTLLFTSDMHHKMLAAIVDSYTLFPVKGILPDAESMLEVIKTTITLSFKIGVQISLPFIIVGTIVQIAFGLLSRLMPQLQVFFLAMPLQIFLSLVMLAVTLSAGMLFWLNGFESIALHPFSP